MSENDATATAEPTRADADRQKELKERELMRDLGGQIADLEARLNDKKNDEAHKAAELKVIREEMRKLEDEKDDAAHQLALIAVGKQSELLPFNRDQTGQPAAAKRGPIPNTVTDAGAWRGVRWDSLKRPKPLTAKQLEKLEGVGVVTLGDHAEFVKGKGTGWGKAIKGFGETGQRRLDDLLAQFFVENPQPNPTAPPPAQQAAAAAPIVPAKAKLEPLIWFATDTPATKKAFACVGTDTERFFFLVTARDDGRHVVNGSPALMFDPAPPESFETDTGACQWCEDRNAHIFETEIAQQAPAAPAAQPEAASPEALNAEEAAQPLRMGPSAAPAVSEDEAGRRLGIPDGEMSETELAALRVGAAHQTGIIAGDAASPTVITTLFKRGMCEPDGVGEPRITDLGFARLGYQPELDNWVKRGGAAAATPETPPTLPAPESTPPTGTAAPAQPQQAAQPVKRGRGRPPGAKNKPKAPAEAPPAAAAV